MNFLTKKISKEYFQNIPITVIDCGARGGTETLRWRDWQGPVTIYGFDADKEECDKLYSKETDKHITYKIIPGCISDCERDGAKFYICQRRGGNSLYEPNLNFAERLKHIQSNEVCSHGDNIQIVKTIKLDTITINSWAEEEEIESFDFIKLDLQGAELEALKGADKYLESCLAIEVEVEFVKMYQEQPLFADVDIYLRSQSFEFFDFLFTHGGHYAGRVASPITHKLREKAPTPQQKIGGQLLSADALYMKDPIQDKQNFNKLDMLKLICFAEMNKQIEYSFELLSELSEISSVQDKKLQQIYQEALEWYQNEYKRLDEIDKQNKTPKKVKEPVIKPPPPTKLIRMIPGKNEFLKFISGEFSNDPLIQSLGIAIYGAGKHTAWLLDNKDPQFPEIKYIIDDNAKMNQFIKNIPVIKPNDFILDSTAAILISSDAHEKTLYLRCKKLFSNKIRLITFYRHFS